MNRLIIAIIATFIVTIMVLTTQPKLHKNVQIGGADFGYHDISNIQNIETNISNIDTKNSEMKVKNISNMQNVEARIKNTDIKNTDIALKNVDRNTYMERIRSKAHLNTNDELDKELTKALFDNGKNGKVIKQQTNLQTYSTEVSKIERQTTSNTNKQKTLKEIESAEEIDWSIWRANLANEILRKANSYYRFQNAMGITYDVAFDVDENQNITNVNVSIRHKPSGKYAKPSYDAIRRAITEIDGTDILIFPSRTKRIKTEFKVALVVGKGRTKANPSDYPDMERHKKKSYYYQ